MIDFGGIAGLHAHDHELHAYCPRRIRGFDYSCFA
jgi:hypothetical protein